MKSVLGLLLCLPVALNGVAAADCEFVDRPETRRAFHHWLECEECDAADLKGIVAQADLVPCFEVILEAVELDVESRYRNEIVQRYRRMEAYYAENPAMLVTGALISEDEYVAGEIANRVARLKIRAVEALSAYPAQRSDAVLDRANTRYKESSRPSDVYLLEFMERKRQTK